jgi:hypothetical protein
LAGALPPAAGGGGLEGLFPGPFDGRLLGCDEGGRSLRSGGGLLAGALPLAAGGGGLEGFPGVFGCALAGCPVVGWPTVWFAFGVAGLPGGACLTCGCAAGTLAGRKLSTSFFANGWPGCAARACCWVANGTGGGGGGAFATTNRLATAAGG